LVHRSFGVDERLSGVGVERESKGVNGSCRKVEKVENMVVILAKWRWRFVLDDQEEVLASRTGVYGSAGTPVLRVRAGRTVGESC
jgi:hypothetical protein